MTSDTNICVRYDNNQAQQRNSKSKDDMKKQVSNQCIHCKGTIHARSWALSICPSLNIPHRIFMELYKWLQSNYYSWSCRVHLVTGDILPIGPKLIDYIDWKICEKKINSLNFFLQLLTINLKRDGITHKSWPMSPESAAISPVTDPADARLAFKGKQLQCFYRPKGKVMFSQVSVCSQSASRMLVHCSALLRRGRYASYWNAFLFPMGFSFY